MPKGSINNIPTLVQIMTWRRPSHKPWSEPMMVSLLSGVPDLWDRNKIMSCGDLSHYQVPHCIRVFFYFVWFVFIHHNFQFYFELCTYCNILDIYLSWNLNFVNYLLFYMKLLNYLFFNMFGSVLGCCELTGVSLLWTRMALANEAKIGLVLKNLGIYHGVYFDCIIIINLRGYIDLLDTSVIVFVNNLLWFVFLILCYLRSWALGL